MLDIDSPDALELLRRAPAPDQATRLTTSRISAALRRASRRGVDAKTAQLQAILGAEQLRQPPVIQSADAAIVTSQVAVIEALSTQIDQLGAVVSAHFGPHPDAEIYASQPGLGTILAARVLGEFGDDPHRYLDAKARNSYAGTAPITRASGTRKIVLAPLRPQPTPRRALQQWAFCSLRGSPGARA